MKYWIILLMFSVFCWYVHDTHKKTVVKIETAQEIQAAQVEVVRKQNPTSDLILPTDMGRDDNRRHYSIDDITNN